jgi:SOS-response transcriptional repressor LexA
MERSGAIPTDPAIPPRRALRLFRSSGIRDGLTDRQREVFRYLVAFTLDHLYQPSVQEMMAHFGCKGANGIVCHLKALETKGYLRFARPHRARAIAILRRPRITVESDP